MKNQIYLNFSEREYLRAQLRGSINWANIQIFYKKLPKNLFVSENSCTFAPAFKTTKHWRDGRVVDYSSLENYRTERYRGFESLSLRNVKAQSFGKQTVALFVYMSTPIFTPTFLTDLSIQI